MSAEGRLLLACCCIQPRKEDGRRPMSMRVAANSALPASMASKADSAKKFCAQNCINKSGLHLHCAKFTASGKLQES